MLRVLQQACDRAGVRLSFGARVDDVDTLAREHDMVVACDGASSHTRTTYADHFKPSFERRRNKFAWYGTHQRFHPVSLIFRTTEHGVFIAHSYQYSRDLSTFLVEVDPDTWQRAGLDRANETESMRVCAEVFADDLGGQPLLANRSLWFEAQIVRNECWSYRNIVLLGDALRTVHFSLGSGTRMAMQDAIALNQALAAHGPDVPAVFQAFEASRRGSSTAFQAAAARSLDWYETVARKMPLDPVSFAYDYMLRTGQVSHDDLWLRDPHFAELYEARLAIEPGLAPA